MAPRLSAAVLATWLAFLGTVLPACACAAAAPVQSCCPDAQPSECTDGDPVQVVPADVLCLNISPAAARSAFVLPDRAGLGREIDSRSPDIAIPPSPVTALARDAARRDGAVVFAAVSHRDDSSIYLHTLRLRL